MQTKTRPKDFDPEEAKTIAVQIVGTDPFWNNYSNQSASNKMDDILSWISDKWSTNIEDGSNEYDAGVTAQYTGGVTIPASALPDNNALNDRLYAADDWLKNNEGNLYSGAESIVVVDYYGDDSGTYGWGYIGSAGDDDDICGLVDTHHEDNGNLPTELSNVESEGVGFHELLHTFNAEHPSDVSTYSNRNYYDYISIMYSWDGVSCTDGGNTEIITDFTSSCATNSVRNYIDNNNLS
ncbi:hypothetical protein [Halorussus caseinilyticus]|uniref:Uncharacterized protein n=1 Tax=Halorussus caseinilyticus TaxID=3034025 RepID=A0ABD5WVY1_9EURY|nr:hypothetical protein [Halorussus sp. DT72]